MLLLVLGLTGVNAQTKLYVKEKAGGSTAFELSNIRKLTFSNGNLTVNKVDGNSSNFGLNDLRYMSFTDFSTGIQPISNLGKINFRIFPNPATDEIQMSYVTQKTGQLSLEIIDLQGKILHQEMILTQNGTNTATINISQLRRGLNMYRIMGDNKSETRKFVKN